MIGDGRIETSNSFSGYCKGSISNSFLFAMCYDVAATGVSTRVAEAHVQPNQSAKQKGKREMNIALWIVSGLLAFAMLTAGGICRRPRTKLMGEMKWAKTRATANSKLLGGRGPRRNRRDRPACHPYRAGPHRSPLFVLWC